MNDVAIFCLETPSISPLFFTLLAADDSDPGITAFILTALSVLLIIVTMPFSLCVTVKVSECALHPLPLSDLQQSRFSFPGELPHYRIKV